MATKVNRTPWGAQAYSAQPHQDYCPVVPWGMDQKIDVAARLFSTPVRDFQNVVQIGLGKWDFGKTAIAKISPKAFEAMDDNQRKADYRGLMHPFMVCRGIMPDSVDGRDAEARLVDANNLFKSQNLPRLEIDPAVPAGKVIVTDRTGQASVTMTVL